MRPTAAHRQHLLLRSCSPLTQITNLHSTAIPLRRYFVIATGFLLRLQAGLVYGVGTEDMDALTFGSKKMLRHMHKSEAQKLPILEIDLAIALKELGMTVSHSHVYWLLINMSANDNEPCQMDEFIDVCILCGCDYADSIRGIGPKKAFEMIKKYGTIEKLVDALDKSKVSLAGVCTLRSALSHRGLVRCCSTPCRKTLTWTSAASCSRTQKSQTWPICRFVKLPYPAGPV